jgi:zinc transport system substrate-binding protein
MSKLAINPIWIAVYFLLAFLGIFAANQAIPQKESFDIAASIHPIYDITSNIAGDTLSVGLILPADASPHTFDPSPQTIRSLQDTKVTYTIGHDFDAWTNSISSSTGTETVIIDNDIELIADEHHDTANPHYWLDIGNAILITYTIADDLSARYPEHEDTFTENAASYIAELIETREEIFEILSTVENRNLVTLHDAWEYFASSNDLIIAGSYEPSPGQEPTPQSLADLIRTVEEAGVTTIYSEPQLASASIEAFANDNAITVSTLDPIGGSKGRTTYQELMIYNAKIIAQNQ